MLSVVTNMMGAFLQAVVSDASQNTACQTLSLASML